MKVTVESTEQFVTLLDRDQNVVAEARVWSGVTEGGVKLQMLVARVAADQDQDLSQFERELKEQPAPRVPVEAFPTRIIL